MIDSIFKKFKKLWEVEQIDRFQYHALCLTSKMPVYKSLT